MMQRRNPMGNRVAGLLVLAMLAGCADLQGLIQTPQAQTVPDQTGGGNITQPTEQLLSNGAATAISDIEATLRDVGALKHMASQRPLISNSGASLISNSGASLISNGLGSYRVAALSTGDVDRIVWSDSRAADWPGAGTFDGTITGTLDGEVVEQYSYTVTMDASSYRREEQVEKSSFREKGLYVVTGSTAFYEDAPGFLNMVATGSSTFDPQGVKRVLDYSFDALVAVSETSFETFDVATDVAGQLPSGAQVQTELLYFKDKVTDSPLEYKHTFKAKGQTSVGGRSLRFDSRAEVLDAGTISGKFQLGLFPDQWLRFDFASNTPIAASLRDDADKSLGDLPVTEDKAKFIVTHPDGQKEHLPVASLPTLYLYSVKTALPPF